MASPMIGELLGSFRIEAELGSGAMGVVYLGFQEARNRRAAIKVIAADQMTKGRAFDRFLREASILEQFKHPNIVKYLARGKMGGTHYYAMEYITGPTLDKVLRDRGPLPWREVVAIAIQLCDALHYSHEHGVVHRDLKPSNLMITEKNQLKLTDFEIAKDLDATALTGTGRTVGTAAYMAPEQIRGTPEISHKTDLYALGAVLYQMLTNEPPFTGASPVVLMHAHINSPPPKASAKTEHIPRPLDELILALMAKAPSERPWDAAAVGLILRDLQSKDHLKQPIEMVWPEAGTAASMPTRAEILDSTITASSNRPKGKRRSKKSVAWKEIGRLVAGLVAVTALFVYLSMPLSQDTLYKRAKVGMESPHELDWVMARDEYVKPLDDRFPRHPYKAETEAWLDKLDLREADRRAANLEASNLAAFSKPKNPAEALFQYTFVEATAALKIHHDGDAEAFWRKMETKLTTEGRANRGWILLAHNKADELSKAIRLRRETVTEQLARASVPPNLASNDAVQRYRTETLQDLVNRFGDYPDVADLVAKAKEEIAASGPSK